MSDVDDVQGGTTEEGIHLGAMAGTLDIVQRRYTGLEICGDLLRLDPAIPEALASIGCSVLYRGEQVDVQVRSDAVRVHLDADATEAVAIDIAGQLCLLHPGETMEVDLPAEPVADLREQRAPAARTRVVRGSNA